MPLDNNIVDRLSNKDLLDLMMRKDNPFSLAWKQLRHVIGWVDQVQGGIMNVRRAEARGLVEILHAAGVGMKLEPGSPPEVVSDGGG